MKKVTAVLLCCICCQINLFSQATKADPRDTEGWYSASLKLDLPKKWESNLTYESRFYNNLQTHYGTYVSLSLGKALSSVFRLQAEYRKAFLNYGVTHRYSIGLEVAKKSKKKIEFNARLLLQNRVQDAFDPLEETKKTLFWRVRGLIKYPLHKNLDIYSSFEPIMVLGVPKFIDNWRYGVGFKIKVLPKTKLDVSYLYRADYGKAKYNRYYNIIDVNVTHNIKLSKKNKKS
jgi:hypothetical protein